MTHPSHLIPSAKQLKWSPPNMPGAGLEHVRPMMHSLLPDWSSKALLVLLFIPAPSADEKIKLAALPFNMLEQVFDICVSHVFAAEGDFASGGCIGRQLW